MTGGKFHPVSASLLNQPVFKFVSPLIKGIFGVSNGFWTEKSKKGSRVVTLVVFKRWWEKNPIITV